MFLNFWIGQYHARQRANALVNWGTVTALVNWGMVTALVNWRMVTELVNWETVSAWVIGRTVAEIVNWGTVTALVNWGIVTALIIWETVSARVNGGTVAEIVTAVDVLSFGCDDLEVVISIDIAINGLRTGAVSLKISTSQWTKLKSIGWFGGTNRVNSCYFNVTIFKFFEKFDIPFSNVFIFCNMSP